MSLCRNDADRRIDRLEQELARLQTEQIPQQLEANLIRDQLNATLSTAVVIAHAAVEVLDQLGDSFEESVERMSQDLNGKDS